MAWFIRDSYRRDSGYLSPGRLSDSQRFEATSEAAAIAEISSVNRPFFPEDDFAVLLNAREDVIWPANEPGA
jgi:hypothetical protein